MQKFCFFCTIFAALIMCSCSRATEKEPEANTISEEIPAAEVFGTTFVLFGNGFNDPQFVEAAQHSLTAEFGEVSGIRTLVFPTDFGGGRTGRISMLPELLRDENINGLIMLGAPDGTHRALVAIEDKGLDFPICSFFPQDNLLGQSAGSDFVIEIATTDTETSEDAQQTAADTQAIINLLPPLIHYLNMDETLPQSGEKLQKKLEKIFENGWSVRFYTDAQSGIRAANCFLIEPKEDLPRK